MFPNDSFAALAASAVQLKMKLFSCPNHCNPLVGGTWCNFKLALVGTVKLALVGTVTLLGTGKKFSKDHVENLCLFDAMVISEAGVFLTNKFMVLVCWENEIKVLILYRIIMNTVTQLIT